MSKKHKTRQEKIIADLRRKLEATGATSEPVKKETVAPSTITYTPKPQIGAQPQINLSTIPTSYIKRDLTKTLALTILAISLEFVLYFLLG